ncbi:MAG TPA: HD-GYP domain-containing protein [Bacillota bacterium]|nr:HD-GYP domain-containing protein [Bacillota bacterium]
MRFIRVDQIEPGMILAKTLYDENTGTVLLSAGLPIKPQFIQRIKELGYETVCVFEPHELTETIKLDPIREDTRAKGLKIIKETMGKLCINKTSIEMKEVQELIDEIIFQILSDPLVGLDLVQIRTFDNYLFMHSVNVGVTAVLIGSLMGMTRNQLQMLGVGAIMHDVGKTMINPDILNKSDKLKPTEYEIIKNHTKNGFDLLKTRTSLSFLSAHVAYQHHEREDGSGYPRRLKSDQIHVFAKITAVADTFDAMTSPRRFQDATSPELAIAAILQDVPKKYDSQVVDKLTRFVLS